MTLLIDTTMPGPWIMHSFNHWIYCEDYFELSPGAWLCVFLYINKDISKKNKNKKKTMQKNSLEYIKQDLLLSQSNLWPWLCKLFVLVWCCPHKNITKQTRLYCVIALIAFIMAQSYQIIQKSVIYDIWMDFSRLKTGPALKYEAIML